MNLTIIIIIAIVVIAFLVTNHFKEQEINIRTFTPFFIFAIIIILNYLKSTSLKTALLGLILRFILGMGIGILQGYLAKVYKVNGKVVASGTKIGLAFWLIFIPVRLFVLPWFNVIVPEKINLESASYIGISFAFVLTGFFLAKGIILYIRKNTLTKQIPIE